MYSAPRSLALVALALALSASGCRKPADDATLSANVQTRLSGDAALSSESIQSTVQSGIATLNGNVSSDAARVLAANDVAQVPGIKTVVNNLTVSNTALSTPPQNLPAPASATVTTPLPTRIPTVPTKPSAAVERRQIAPVTPANPFDRQAPVAQTAPPAQPAAPPPPAFRNVTIPSGTSISVRITQTLDSATTQQGDSFSGSVASDVLVDGLVAIPQGTAVSGRVDTVQEAAHFKGNSLLTIEATSISRRGERLPITTEAYSKEGAGRGKNTAVKTGVGAAAGAVLGGIFGGGKGAAIGAAAGGGTGAGVNAVTRGQQVQIPSESLVPFRLSSPLSVRVPTGDRNRSQDSGEGQRRPLE